MPCMETAWHPRSRCRFRSRLGPGIQGQREAEKEKRETGWEIWVLAPGKDTRRSGTPRREETWPNRVPTGTCLPRGPPHPRELQCAAGKRQASRKRRAKKVRMGTGTGEAAGPGDIGAVVGSDSEARLGCCGGPTTEKTARRERSAAFKRRRILLSSGEGRDGATERMSAEDGRASICSTKSLARNIV